MESLASNVKFPPVSVVLHWPDRFCPTCTAETETISDKLYYCPSCAKYTCGRTQIVGATVHAVR